MGSINWIKLSVHMFNDEKIKLIRTLPEGDSITLLWIQLLAMAGKTNDGGRIYLGENIPYTDEMITTICGLTLTVVRSGLSILQQFGMLDIDEDGIIFITNWEKHQNIEGMDKVREQTRKRVQKHRNKKKMDEISDGNVTVTQSNATDKNRIEKNRIDKNRKEESKKKYGEHLNVLLTDEEFEKLKSTFSSDYQERIDNLSFYIGSTGKTYKSHYLTILNWARKDTEKKKSNQPNYNAEPDFIEMLEIERRENKNV